MRVQKRYSRWWQVVNGEVGVIAVRERGRGGGMEAEMVLLDRVVGGDRAAFEQLYRLYRPRLTRFLLNLIRRPTLVEEVLNDTMMVVWHRADSFNGASKLSTWIFAIAYRKAMKGLKRQDEAVEDKDADNRISDEAGPEEESSRHRLNVLLMRAMDDLSPAHRAVVDLTYFHELGYREIAAILECPVDTVKTRMFHARRHLRRRLAGQLADWI
ncbi:MAG TPA: sigma-70 family RNA polymerase sigma factor [Sphingomonas sp.]